MRKQINELIDELQAIKDRYGNTCVHYDRLSWGSVALWREAEEKGECLPLVLRHLTEQDQQP